MAEDEVRVPEVKPAPAQHEERSLTRSAAVDAALYFVNGAAGAAGAHLVNQVLHRPPKEPPPQSPIVLPPGVERE